MGVGMSIITSPETADAAMAALKAHGETAYVIGEIAKAGSDGSKIEIL
jgi:phosphoribosylaminoimidazole (AIR) synthetase